MHWQRCPANCNRQSFHCFGSLGTSVKHTLPRARCIHAHHKRCAGKSRRVRHRSVQSAQEVPWEARQAREALDYIAVAPCFVSRRGVTPARRSASRVVSQQMATEQGAGGSLQRLRKHVVTAFVQRPIDGAVLLVKRSEKVGLVCQRRRRPCVPYVQCI